MSGREIISTRAVCAMSGGVDSSVAAVLALEQGFHCVGITLKLFKEENNCNLLPESAPPDINDAKNVADKLCIDHNVIDLCEEFDRHVVRHFVDTYEQGETPNPCIECNKHIKFNQLINYACKKDFNYLVTGHYARVKKDDASGRYLLQKALDEKKDQSYVLYCLTQQQLAMSFFPLGSFSKSDVRKIAEEKKLLNAKKSESQDICFVPDGNYAGFIEKYTKKNYPPGDIIDINGKILGRHKGLIRYTIGQRRGLGVAANVPFYVAAKSITANTVTLAAEDALYSKSLSAKNINLIACEDLKKPMRVMVKTRYLQAAQSAVAEQTAEDSLHIVFDTPQRAITPGQAAVMYDGDTVIGGGVISGTV